MTIPFSKFDGAGNDFVIVDNRNLGWHPDEEQVTAMCHRRFGIGADGLMTLEHPADGDYAFEMRYYNSDGRLGSMCGNGGRCIAAFAHMILGGNARQLRFMGFDGPHQAEILAWDGHLGLVRLGMRSVAYNGVQRVFDGWFLDTGSPHYVQRVSDLQHFDVVGEGRRIRNIKALFPEGTNVDFVEDMPDGRLAVRTYERGVEDETWACGTGVTACAIVTGNNRLVTRGGDFRVDFDADGTTYGNVRLTGPVALNFTGQWTILNKTA